MKPEKEKQIPRGHLPLGAFGYKAAADHPYQGDGLFVSILAAWWVQWCQTTLGKLARLSGRLPTRCRARARPSPWAMGSSAAHLTLGNQARVLATDPLPRTSAPHSPWAKDSSVAHLTLGNLARALATDPLPRTSASLTLGNE